MSECGQSFNVSVSEIQKTRFIRKENLMNKLFRFFMLAAFCSLFGVACARQGLHGTAIQPFSGPPMLEPGDQIGSMVITTGAEDAAPLWAFCLPTVNSDHLLMVDCGDDRKSVVYG